MYTKAPEEMFIKEAGRKPVSVRWLDIDKGDKANPEHRSWIVAQETKRDIRQALFAAVPPLEAKKSLFSIAVTEGVWASRRASEGSNAFRFHRCE